MLRWDKQTCIQDLQKGIVQWIDYMNWPTAVFVPEIVMQTAFLINWDIVKVVQALMLHQSVTIKVKSQ
jgi:hypothetical protein